MKCKNKHITVNGVEMRQDGIMKEKPINCIITNDNTGKTISIGTHDNVMFTIPFEPVAKYLKGGMTY